MKVDLEDSEEIKGGTKGIGKRGGQRGKDKIWKNKGKRLTFMEDTEEHKDLMWKKDEGERLTWVMDAEIMNELRRGGGEPE